MNNGYLPRFWGCGETMCGPAKTSCGTKNPECRSDANHVYEIQSRMSLPVPFFIHSISPINDRLRFLRWIGTSLSNFRYCGPLPIKLQPRGLNAFYIDPEPASAMPRLNPGTLEPRIWWIFSTDGHQNILFWTLRRICLPFFLSLGLASDILILFRRHRLLYRETCRIKPPVLMSSTNF